MISMIKKTIFTACLAVSMMSSAFAVAPDFMEKLNADSRPMEDKVRDGSRRPYQVMQLLGVEEGMTVVDIGAGGGWYTRVLSAAVGQSGKVISQSGPRALGDDNGAGARASWASYGNVEISFGDLADMDSNIADVAITGLNMHHSDAERAIPTLRNLMAVLKPGGVAAIIDHAGSPEINNARLHRMVAADLRGWILESSLEIVEESDILRTTADDHTMSTTDPALGGNSDRFIFVVRKPE
jgi:predicted methyltransferase